MPGSTRDLEKANEQDAADKFAASVRGMLETGQSRS